MKKSQIAGSDVRKLIQNATVLAKDSHFLKYLGVVTNKPAPSAADNGATASQPTIFMEKGGLDLDTLLFGTGTTRNVSGTPTTHTILGKDGKTYYVRDILQDMAKGIAYMHAQDLAHLDLKPMNTLMGLDNIVKIIDTEDAATVTAPSKTDPGDTYSLYYASPERLKGIFTTTPLSTAVDWLKSDVYALGISYLSILSALKDFFIIALARDCLARDGSGKLTGAFKTENRCNSDHKDFKKSIADSVMKGEVFNYLSNNLILSSNLSGIYVNLILKMIDPNPANRPSMTQVQSLLNQYYP